jgi:inhibitor of KinA
MAGTDVVRIVPAGDAALVVEFPPRIDPEINERASALADAVRRKWNAVLRDVVIGYSTVTIYFDPTQIDGRWVESEIDRIAGTLDPASSVDRDVIEVPACYDGDFAPDLADVAAFAGCSREEVVALHAERAYRVYMVGFIPGFAYLAEVDARIAAPRRPTPRTMVPAGSVAVAGGQTGIYPAAMPGGWNIIGRTPLKPFDASRTEPVLFRSGDRVRFVPISRDEFERAGG